MHHEKILLHIHFKLLTKKKKTPEKRKRAQGTGLENNI